MNRLQNVNRGILGVIISNGRYSYSVFTYLSRHKMAFAPMPRYQTLKGQTLFSWIATSSLTSPFDDRKQVDACGFLSMAGYLPMLSFISMTNYRPISFQWPVIDAQSFGGSVRSPSSVRCASHLSMLMATRLKMDDVLLVTSVAMYRSQTNAGRPQMPFTWRAEVTVRWYGSTSDSRGHRQTVEVTVRW